MSVDSCVMIDVTPRRADGSPMLISGSKRASVYVLWDADDRPIYVGQTQNIRARLNDHRCNSEWFSEVARVTTSDEMDRGEAIYVEGHLVRLLRPRHNKTPDGQGHTHSRIT